MVSLSELPRRFKRFLPQGGLLTEEEWSQRHRVVVALLWVHAVGLTVFALIRGYSLQHGLTDCSVIALCAVVARSTRLSRKLQSVVTAFGLVTASAVFVHLSGMAESVAGD